MGVYFSQILVLAISLLLVLPPNWCCYLGVGECCGTGKQSCCTPPRTEEVPANPEGLCCCCPEDPSEAAQKVPSKPAKSNEPGKSICCERLPIDRPANDKLPDLTASVLGYALVETTTFPSQFADKLLEDIVVSSPSSHILHCVWLC
jgi:hypothetical protein